MAQQYERLSSLDASFLALETRTTHMHVAGVSVFEAGPLLTADGGVDIARIRRFIESRLQYVPRYRQRLAWVPVERHPIWVDDDHFNLEYHVRHTSLPHPGSDEQLKDLAGRIISQQLDRQKPLWEMWVVEGLENNRLAIVSKIHHAMIDGVAAAGIMGVIMNVMPTSDVDEPEAWTPTPPPNDAEVVVGEVARRLTDSLHRMRNVRRAADDTRQVVEGGLRKARAVYYSLGSGWLSQSAATPLNEPIGPNRRFDWVETPLQTIREIRAGLGGTVNDVVLATTAGAVRRFLLEHRELADLDVDFRVMAPVSVRPNARSGELGNHVAMWLVSLPIDKADPIERLAAIKRETMHLKQTEQAMGAQTIVAASGGAPHTLVSLGARLATGVRPFNMTVTNVPGPQFPMYLLEARLVGQYPVVPLFHRHGVGLALFSYDGTVAWGINADWDVLPDTDVLGAAIQSSLTELHGLASAAQRADAAPTSNGAPEPATKPARRQASAAKTTPAPKRSTTKKTPAKAAAAAKTSATTARTSAAKKAGTTKKAATGQKKSAQKKSGQKKTETASKTSTAKAGNATKTSTGKSATKSTAAKKTRTTSKTGQTPRPSPPPRGRPAPADQAPHIRVGSQSSGSRKNRERGMAAVAPSVRARIIATSSTCGPKATTRDPRSANTRIASSASAA